MEAWGSETEEGSWTGQPRWHAPAPCRLLIAMTKGGSRAGSPVALEMGGVPLPGGGYQTAE